MARKKYKTVEEYIRDFPPETQAILQKIRETIAKEVPNAQEKISYNIPSFHHHGYFIYFAAYGNHIGIYPIPTGTAEFRKKIAPLIFGKGTVRFSLDKPIPYDVLKQMVQLRLKDTLSRKDK